MDRNWTWRDWMFCVLLAAVMVLILLQMKQSDRLYERLNQLIDVTNNIRKNMKRGALTLSEGDNSPIGDWCVHNTTEPATLNPITAKDVYEGTVNQYVMEHLLERNDETLKLEPRLCVDYEISPDGLQYTFNLRQGVTWHDGEPFGADDVVYSFNVIMDNETDCSNLRNYYEGIRVEKTGPYQVRFTSSKRYWKAFSNCGQIPILPKHLFEKDAGADFNSSEWGRHPIGTGPYRFIRWDAKQQIVLERDPCYWNAARNGSIDRIVFKFILNETAEMEAVKKQKIDYSSCTPEQWGREAEQPAVRDHFQRLEFDSLSFNYIGWNERTPFFADKRVRRAMTQCVPRDEFLRTRLRGLGRVVSGPFYVNSDAYDRTIEPWPYDPNAARKLLDDAGWKDTNGDGVRDDGKGNSFRFQLLIPAGRTLYQDLAVTVQKELKGVGVEMSIGQLDWASFLKKMDDRDYEAVMLGWSLDLEEDPYQLWHSTQTDASGSNFIFFADREADRLIEESRREFDEAKRNVLLRRLHRILHEEQPYTFLFNEPSLVLLHNRFEGVRRYPLGTNLLDWHVTPKRWKYE